MATLIDRVREGVRAWAAMDPAGWGTGLSPAGARRALDEAAGAVLAAPLAPRPRPPRRLVIWCAGNVFTAPAPWAAWFASMQLSSAWGRSGSTSVHSPK